MVSGSGRTIAMIGKEHYPSPLLYLTKSPDPGLGEQNWNYELVILGKSKNDVLDFGQSSVMD